MVYFPTSTFTFVLAILSSPLTRLVLSAPTQLDENTLLKNGQNAQVLNAEFANLKTTDACTSGQTACINDATAMCVDNKWTTKRCTTGQCFALPSIRDDGVTVQCTSQATAVSIINATGAKGGITSTDKNAESTDIPLDSETATSDPASQSGDTSGGASTVTVTSTVTQLSGSTATPSPVSTSVVTTTISPAAAAQLISSLQQGSSTQVSTSSAPSVTPAASSTDTPASPPPVITLTPKAVSTTAATASSTPVANTSSVISLGALAAASPTPTAGASTGGSSGYY